MDLLCIFYGVSKTDVGICRLKSELEHGRLQVCCFQKKNHGIEAWSRCRRGSMNFSFKIHVVDNFMNYSRYVYNQYVEAGYPRTDCISYNGCPVFT